MPLAAVALGDGEAGVGAVLGVGGEQEAGGRAIEWGLKCCLDRFPIFRFRTAVEQKEAVFAVAMGD